LTTKSLRRKLFTGVLLSSIVALLFTCASLFAYDLHTYRKASANDLAVQAELIASATAAALQFDDPKAAAQNLAFLRARPEIRSAAVYTAQGKLFATYFRAGVDPNALPRALGVPGIALVEDQVRVLHPVLANGEPVGTVYLESDLDLRARIASYLAIALVVTLLALGVAMLLSSWFQSGVTRPLIEMSRLARDVVETRDYSLRAKAVTADDEVGTLAHAMNEMLEEIQHRTTALQRSAEEIGRLNEFLEKRVADRTAELEDTNRKLAAASTAKSSFLSTMSHEIRTPMNGVLGMLELLSLTPLDGQQRTTLEVVRESGRSLLRIIDDILDFSKIEAGKLEVRREVASVAKVMSNVRGIYSGNASSKGLLLEIQVDPRISPAVLVDALRLQQILNNFVSNAIKFTARGSIVVKAELVGRSGNEDIVRFSVTDTGIGISPEGRARLFQPFAQAGGDIAHVYGGTGLGLSICSRLARLMGGSVGIESEPGKGTVVSVTLPLQVVAADTLPAREEPPADAARERRVAPSVEQAAAEGNLVLVVDDHPINRLVMSRQVSALGYANETAENGREALERWATGRYRLFITDVNMPEMDGYQLARAIRAQELARGSGHTVIIACTANALRGEAENCFAAGMDDYVVKPLELTRLHRKLLQWMPGAPPLDRTALEAIAGDDANLQIETVKRFLAATDDDTSALIQAIDAHELPAAVQAAHRIKGASATVGAASLAEVAGRIETAARDGDWERVVGEREAFHRELARLSAYLVALASAAAESHAGTISKSRLG